VALVGTLGGILVGIVIGVFIGTINGIVVFSIENQLQNVPVHLIGLRPAMTFTKWAVPIHCIWGCH